MIDIFATLIIVIFWGFQTGNLIFSIILSLFLVLPLITESRNKFSFNLFKFASIVTYFLFVIVIYYYLNNNVIFFLGGVLKWSPLIFLPIVALEVYSHDRKTPIMALLIFSRFDKRKAKLLYFYILITVLAISTGKMDIYFYMFIIIFFNTLLYYIKPKRYSYIIWLFSFMLIVTSSFIIKNGISNAHQKIVSSIIHFIMGINRDHIDISKSSTRIGSMGKVKLSNEIKYRLKASIKDYPSYLREATFTKYFQGDWIAPKSEFLNFNQKLCPNNNETLNASLIGEFKKNSILPLPTRISKIIKRNKTESFSKNDLMVVRRTGNEVNSMNFDYYKGNVSCADKVFSYDDLKVPKNELKYIRLFIKNAKLSSNMPEAKVLERLYYIFNNDFRYTLNLKENKSKTALGSFLLDQKAGHCEYFATATTLILRELGIPARYTIGYSVQEYSDFQELFIIRERHAHAWVRVYINNAWHNFDTTPSSWGESESKGFSFYYKIYDFFSYIEYKFKSSSIWSYLKRHYEYSIVFLIIIFIIIRYLNKNNANNETIIIKKRSKVLKKIDKTLKKKGIKRDDDIPIEIWLKSLPDNEKDIIKHNELNEIIGLYYMYRFSNQELSKKSLKTIYKKIKRWKKSL